MIIIGLVGLLSAGKGTAAEYIVKKYNASKYGFSDSLRDIVRRLHLEENRTNLQNISTALRREFGEDLLARAMSLDIQGDTHDIVVVEGIRREADIKFLREFPSFHLIGIGADIKIRYDRLIKRAQNSDDAQKTFEQFIADHQKEAELEIPSLMEKTEFTLDNSGAPEQLYAAIDEIISKLKS